MSGWFMDGWHDFLIALAVVCLSISTCFLLRVLSRILEVTSNV